MFKQLFLSTALVTAFAATPVLADKHGNKNADDPEWEQKVNETENHAENNTQDKNSQNTNRQGETKTYDDVRTGDDKVVPDKKAYDENSDDGNQQHPAHEMGEGDPVREQGQ